MPPYVPESTVAGPMKYLQPTQPTTSQNWIQDIFGGTPTGIQQVAGPQKYLQPGYELAQRAKDLPFLGDTGESMDYMIPPWTPGAGTPQATGPAYTLDMDPRSLIEKGKDYIQGIKVSDTIVGDDGKEYIAYNRTDNVSNFKRYSATMRSNIVNYLDNKFTDTDSREYQAIQNLKTTGTLTSDERQLLLPHMRDAVITRAGTNPELKRSVNAIIAGHTVMNENIDTQIFKRLDDSLQNTIRNNSNEVNKINSQINALRRSIADAKAVPIAKRKRGLEGEISRQEEVIADLQKQKENFEFNIQRAEVNVAERTVVKGLLKNRIIARAVADKNLDQLNQPDVVRQYVAEVLRDASFQEEASSLVKQLQQSGLVSRPQQKSDKGTKTISEQDKDKEEEEEEEELKGGRKLEITPLATTPSPSG